jgi:hypothetical protein
LLSTNNLAKEQNVPWSYTRKAQAAIIAYLDDMVVSASDTSIRVLASSSVLDMDMLNSQKGTERKGFEESK